MAHYDYLYETVSREDITERINNAEKRIKSDQDNKDNLMKDIKIVTTEIGKKAIEKEMSELERWIRQWERSLNKLNEALKRHDEGFKVSNYELR